jgi:hypothetical protein
MALVELPRRNPENTPTLLQGWHGWIRWIGWPVPPGRNTAQAARNDQREEGLSRDDIMLAQLYYPGAVSGQHTPRGI